jgi:hypothetical protein
MRTFSLSASVFLIVLGFVVIFPAQRVLAVGNVADTMCAVWIPTHCGCKQVDGPNGSCQPNPQNTYGCPVGICKDTTNLFATDGICVAPGRCQGMTTSGPNGFGLGQVAQILGPLMSALMQNSQNGSASPTDTSLSSACQTNTSATSVSGQLTGATTTIATLTIAAGTSTAVTLAGTADLSASTTTGPVPLAVTFSTKQAGMLDFGDGQSVAVAACTVDTSGNCAARTAHTYTTQGVFTVALSTTNATGACDYGYGLSGGYPSGSSSLLGYSPNLYTSSGAGSLISSLTSGNCSDPTTCGLSNIASQLTSTLNNTGSLVPNSSTSTASSNGTVRQDQNGTPIPAASSTTKTVGGGEYQGTGSNISPQGVTVQKSGTTLVFQYSPAGENAAIAGFISCNVSAANAVPYIPLSAIQNACR